MSRKKILWLCSWYPNRLEPFNGDFIQRHAQAASLYNDIYVIHVAADASGRIKNREKEIQGAAPLTEERNYYSMSTSFVGKLAAHYRLLLIYRQAIRQYIRKHGKPDLVHVHIPIKAGIFGIWMKRKYGIPFLLSEHWGIYNDVVDDKFGSRSRAFQLYTKKIFSQAAAFISVSRFLAAGVQRLVTPKPFTVIPNTVNTELFYYRENKHDPFRFIHVSNMVPLKNAEGILRAFSKLPAGTPAQLLLVGDTDPAIRAFADSLGLKREQVQFRGEIPYPQVAAAMQEADCLVLFSHIENSPCVIGEALCCGLPVIASRVGGIPELVDDTCALLVEARDEAALTAAMMRMLDRKNSFDRKQIAQTAGEKFSYPAVGRQFDQLYKAIKAGSR